MFLFIARHAQSKTNRDYWQTPESKLGELGKKQAEALGERLKLYRIDQIFSSDWERSRKTAEIISKKLRVDYNTLDYIHERRQLSEICGARMDSEISKKYIKEYRDNFGDLDWKFKGKEESVREVLNRSSKLLDFLVKKYQGRRVLVVSHDIFIKCLISSVLFGVDYTEQSMSQAIRSLTVNSAGLSLLIHDSRKGIWKVNYVNNYSHLGGIERKLS